MSKSINLLLKNLSEQGGRGDNAHIFNPAIPHDNAARIPRGAKSDGIIDDKLNIADQYHNAFKLTSAGPRNGTGYMLKQRGEVLQRPNDSPFIHDRDIDPNIIRAKVDPDSALPTLSSLALHSLMPSSVAAPHNNVDLIKQSHTSELNYKNRFTPSQQPPADQQPQNPQQPAAADGSNPLQAILESSDEPNSRQGNNAEFEEWLASQASQASQASSKPEYDARHRNITDIP